MDSLFGTLAVRRGHFRLESGFHTTMWADLAGISDRPDAIKPYARALAQRLQAHEPEAICGPMAGGAELARSIAAELGVPSLVAERRVATDDGRTVASYRLAEHTRVLAAERRVAIVDDGISAGSAVGGTYAALCACNARPIAFGTLIAFGGGAQRLATQAGLPLEALEFVPFDMWLPDACPPCAAGIALTDAPAG